MSSPSSAFATAEITYLIHRHGAILESFTDFAAFLARLAALSPAEVRAWYRVIGTPRYPYWLDAQRTGSMSWEDEKHG